MKIDTETIMSLSEANQNFSQVVKKVDEKGSVIVMKNNKPKYVIKPFAENEIILTEEEIIDVVAKRVLTKHINAFRELAK